jgi:hypothetical protein
VLKLIHNVFTGELLPTSLWCAGLFVAVGAATSWAACSRRHWFLRTAVVGAAVAPALLVPGYDFVLVFTVQAGVAWLLLTVTRILRTRAARRADPEAAKGLPPPGPLRFRFTLTDLLLAFVVISAVLSVAARVPASVWAEWKGIGLFGFFFGALSVPLADMALLATRRERLGRMPARRDFKNKRKRIWDTVGLLAFGFELCLMIPFLCAGLAVFHVAIHPAPVPPISLPDPNGYDDLVRAGKQLASVSVPDASEAAAGDLKAFEARYAQVLEAARVGLARPCQVPLTYSPADLSRNDHDLLRELGRAFLAEGKLAEWEGRTGDALDDYLDVLRLGTACTQGGVVVDTLVGWAIHETGVQALAPLADDLDADQCRKAIELAKSIEAGREPIDELLARERLCDEYAFGKTGRALRAVGWDLFENDTRAAIETSIRWNQAKMRLLICALAVRLYRLEHGSGPEQLADLVPGCLPELPVDPYTGRPLVYRASSSGHLLYSVGPDGVDDGGKPIDWKTASDAPRGDLLLQEPEQPCCQ